jgi:hypothetical protein
MPAALSALNHKTGKGKSMTKILDWKRDGDTWRAYDFEIDLMEGGDGKWPPLVPPIRTYLLILGSTSFGSYDTLEAAQDKAEKLDNSRHPETAAAVRRARGLQPPYPVAEAIPFTQEDWKKCER